MNTNLNLAIDRYLKGEASESEKELVDSWYLSFESNPGLTDELSPEEIDIAMAASFASLSRKLEKLGRL